MRRITFIVLILCIFIIISCSKRKEEEVVVVKPEKILLFENVHNKVLQNSEEIQKYIYTDETGDVIVKADIIEINEDDNTMEFQVSYDTRNIQFDYITNEYSIPFTLICLTTNDIADDSLLWKPEEDDTGILLSFDDQYFKVWESYFYMFQYYNASATFFITGRPNNFSLTAIENGHDIGYHSLNHKMLISVPYDEYKNETTGLVDDFRSFGVPLLSFAYPYGRYHEWMNDELLMTYKITRGFTNLFYAYSKTEIKNNFIFSKSIDYYYYNNDFDYIKSINMMLRAIKFTEQNLILPLSSHTIRDNASWGISPGRLDYLLRTARDLKIKFYRFSDFAD